MTLEELIARATVRLNDLLADRQSRTDTLTQLRADLDAPDSPVTEAQVSEAIAHRDALDADITAAQARVDELVAEQARDTAAATLARQYTPRETAAVTVGAEPEVYRRGGQHSFLRDLHLSTAYGRRDASDRLQRHNPVARAAWNERAGLNTTDGSGGELVPPIWLIDEYEPLVRSARVCADQVRNLPLPAGTDSISVPLVTGGSSVAEQTTQGTALSETDMQTSSTTAAVATEGGLQTVSLQLVEQSPINIDDLVFPDLAAELAKQVDLFVLSANATNKHGVLNVTGANAVTYTDDTATFPELWPKLVNAVRLVHTGRKLPARQIWMSPTRWAWMQAQLDANNRPYVSDSLAAAIPLLAQSDGAVPEGLAGTIRGLTLPVYLDGNIPENLGAGTNQDRILAIRPEDFVLYESVPNAESFRETKAKEAQVVYRIYEYLAFLSERSPKSVSIIAGTGLSAPTF